MAEIIDKKFKCPICLKTFTKSHTLKIHMRMHTGHKPHECHICSKSFVTNSALKDHLISHGSIREFVCNRCGGKFKHKGTLKRHQLQHEEYEKNRDHPENIETAVVYESQMPFDSPDTKYFEISPGEAQEKFPEIKEIFRYESMKEMNSQAIVIDGDCQAVVVKQEKLLEEDTLYGAAVLELTEDKLYNQKGISVRVYNVSGEIEDLPPKRIQPKEIKQTTRPIYRPRWPAPQSAGEESQMLDVPSGYGSHVTRILSLLKYSPDKQVALVQKLNKTMHKFIVENRK